MGYRIAGRAHSQLARHSNLYGKNRSPPQHKYANNAEQSWHVDFNLRSKDNKFEKKFESYIKRILN